MPRQNVLVAKSSNAENGVRAILKTGKGSVSRIVIFAFIFSPIASSNIIDHLAMQVQVSSVLTIDIEKHIWHGYWHA